MNIGRYTAIYQLKIQLDINIALIYFFSARAQQYKNIPPTLLSIRLALWNFFLSFQLNYIVLHSN